MPNKDNYIPSIVGRPGRHSGGSVRPQLPGPVDFGSGVNSLVNGVGALGGYLGARQREAQQQRETEAKQALIAANNELSKWFDDELLPTKGLDAAGSSDAYTAKFKEVRDKYGATLTDDARTAFELQFDNGFRGLYSRASNHQRNELNAAEATANKLGMEQYRDRLVLDPADDSGFANFDTFLAAELAREGLTDPEVVSRRRDMEYDRIQSGRVRALVKSGDVEQAREVLERAAPREGNAYAYQVSPEAYKALGAEIKVYEDTFRRHTLAENYAKIGAELYMVEGDADAARLLMEDQIDLGVAPEDRKEVRKQAAASYDEQVKRYKAGREAAFRERTREFARQKMTYAEAHAALQLEHLNAGTPTAVREEQEEALAKFYGGGKPRHEKTRAALDGTLADLANGFYVKDHLQNRINDIEDLRYSYTVVHGGVWSWEVKELLDKALAQRDGAVQPARVDAVLKDLAPGTAHTDYPGLLWYLRSTLAADKTATKEQLQTAVSAYVNREAVNRNRFWWDTTGTLGSVSTGDTAMDRGQLAELMLQQTDAMKAAGRALPDWMAAGPRDKATLDRYARMHGFLEYRKGKYRRATEEELARAEAGTPLPMEDAPMSNSIYNIWEDSPLGVAPHGGLVW